MKAGIDAGVGNLLSIGAEIGEPMRDPGREGARQCDFRDFVGTEHRFDDRCDGGTDDAVRAGIRLPRGSSVWA